MLLFLIGLWVGGLFGVIIMCLLRVSGNSDGEDIGKP